MKRLIFSALIIAASLTAGAQQPRPTCKGTTKAGTACKGTILMPSGFCRTHDPATPRCNAIKADKKPCKMAVKKAGERCRLHAGK